MWCIYIYVKIKIHTNKYIYNTSTYQPRLKRDEEIGNLTGPSLGVLVLPTPHSHWNQGL